MTLNLIFFKDFPSELDLIYFFRFKIIHRLLWCIDGLNLNLNAMQLLIVGKFRAFEQIG